MDKIAHSFGLRRSTRSFAKLSSNPSPKQPPPSFGNVRMSGNKENISRISMGPPALAPAKSHLPPGCEGDPHGSKRAMLSASVCVDSHKNFPAASHQHQSNTSSSSTTSGKKGNGSWDRRLSVGIKRTISKLKLNSKSTKSNYLPVVDYPDTEAPSPTAVSVSSMPIVARGRSGSSTTNGSYETTSGVIYRNGMGASLDQLNTIGSSSGGRYYENQAMSYHALDAQPVAPSSRRVHHGGDVIVAGHNYQHLQASSHHHQQHQPSQTVLGTASQASPYVARPRMGTSALRYPRDLLGSSSRTSRLDQSFNAMLPVAEEQQDGANEGGSFLWKAGFSRYNLRSSRSRLNMSYADERIEASGGVDDSYMVDDLDDTRTGDFDISLAGIAGTK